MCRVEIEARQLMPLHFFKEMDNATSALPESTQNDPPINTETAAFKAASEITTKIEEIFTKLQRNMDHNTRIFQERAQGLLLKIDQAEEQLNRVLIQLDPSDGGDPHSNSRAEPSIALSENSADVTLSSLNQQ
jgi:hypothetical protein